MRLQDDRTACTDVLLEGEYPKWEDFPGSGVATVSEAAPRCRHAAWNRALRERTRMYLHYFAQAGASIALAAFIGAAAAQVELPEPDYVGNIVAVQDGQGVPLEKQRASNRARGGFVRARAANEVEGVKSPVRLAGGWLQFIVRAETNQVDPAQVVSVFQLDTNARREVRLIETGSQGVFAARSMDIDFLSFTSERYGESSYLITLEGVDPGEYAVTLDGSRDVFNMFGVD